MPVYKHKNGSFRIIVYANGRRYERSVRGDSNLALKHEVDLREEVGAKRKDAGADLGPEGAADTFWIGGAKSYVYFVQEGPDGPIKIGYGEHARLRVAAMQVGNPRRLRLRCVIAGGRLLERALHRAFDKQRLEGEWFKPVPGLLALVDEICSATRNDRKLGRRLGRPPKS